MDWSTLPPLASLRAFEAAARHLSFSAAARELNVTHAAVAQQVRALEAHLSLALLHREGRGLALTEAGEALSRGLSDGFGLVAETLARLRVSQGQAPLRVTLTPAFATQWLMPRLGGFWSSHPDVAVTLHPDRELVAIGRGGADVAIRYGKGPWPGLSSEMLVAAQFVIAAAPRLLGGRTALTLDQMSKMPWILEDDWPEQLAWLRDQGIDPKALKATRVPTDELGIVAARQGYGLYIEAAALVQDDVDAGRLIVVHHAQPEGLGYHIVTRPGYQPPALKPFVRWLRSVA